MTVIKSLVWDEWNKAHIAEHGVTIEEVEEVCRHEHKTYETYRGRVELEGRTLAGRKLIIILSSEDRNLQSYGPGVYYPITAFEKGAENESEI